MRDFKNRVLGDMYSDTAGNAKVGVGKEICIVTLQVMVRYGWVGSLTLILLMWRIG